MAAAPSFLLLAVAAAMFKWHRSVGPITAMIFSLGAALLAEFLLVVAAYGFNALYPLRQSLIALPGIPLLIYAITMISLSRQARIILPGAIASSSVGLVGLYFFGGFVLLTSACSYNSGGC